MASGIRYSTSEILVGYLLPPGAFFTPPLPKNNKISIIWTCGKVLYNNILISKLNKMLRILENVFCKCLSLKYIQKFFVNIKNFGYFWEKIKKKSHKKLQNTKKNTKNKKKIKN